jgi:hypothetical protein
MALKNSSIWQTSANTIPPIQQSYCHLDIIVFSGVNNIKPNTSLK